jgi:hypothetical protein
VLALNLVEAFIINDICSTVTRKDVCFIVPWSRM